MSLLHDEFHDEQGRLLLFKCAACGETHLTLGGLHAHVETHWGPLGWLRWHFTHMFRGDPAEKWMEYTEIHAVETTEHVSEDVLP